MEEYLQAESNLISPDLKKPLSVALVYPDYYEYGLPNLGVQTLYREINRNPSFYASRLYLLPKKKGNRQGKEDVLTWEDKKPLREHDIIAFSISFEEQWDNILEILSSANIPFLSRDRDDSYPLVIAGGLFPSYNPEPLADFFDAIFLGEGEGIIHQILETYEFIGRRKSVLLNKLSTVKGGYIPSSYKVAYSAEGYVEKFIGTPNAPLEITRCLYRRFSSNPSHSMIVTPKTIYKEATFSIEVARGCSRRCNFCCYSHSHGGARLVSIKDCLELVKKGVGLSNVIKLFYEAVPTEFLQSLFSGLETLLVEGNRFSLRLGAFEVTDITPDILRIAAALGQPCITVAPETVAGRLRAMLGKNFVTDNDVLGIAKLASKYGIPNFGLYLLIGLPTETKEDIKQLGQLVLNIRSIMDKSGNNRGILEVHINPVFSKPLTPFQWAEMEKIETSVEKIDIIKEVIAKHYEVRVDSGGRTTIGTGYLDAAEECAPVVMRTLAGTRAQFSQPILARGDRRISKILVQVFKKGNTVESWKEALEAQGLDWQSFFKEKDITQRLPWDFIGTTAQKGSLLRKWKMIKNI